ncbi:MAG: hypothetical protein H0W50_09460 [Parachlamydiaceae bacterium]|nr:hypothetical protein [Parachlamydiaceae bacterium]
MGFTVNLVNQLVQEMIPPSVALPKGVMNCCSLLHSLRVYWHHGRQWKKHTNPDNFFKILADRGLPFILGSGTGVKFAAKCIHILRCVTDITHQYAKLYRAYVKIENLIWGYYPVLDETSWHTETSSKSSYISVVGSVTDFFKRKINFIKMLAFRIYKLVKCIFKISMHTMDTVEAASTNEIVSSLIRIKDKYPFNEGELTELFIEKLKKNRPLIQKIISGLRTDADVDQLIGNLEGKINKAQAVVTTVSKVGNSIFDILAIVVKNLSFGLSSNLGLSSYLPTFLIPPLCLPATASQRDFGRFVPRKWITLEKLQPKLHAQKMNIKIQQMAEEYEIKLCKKRLKRVQVCLEGCKLKA